MEEATYFPLMIWNIDEIKMEIVKTPNDIPKGKAFIVVQTNVTGNDFVIAERIRAAIEKSYQLKFEERQRFEG